MLTPKWRASDVGVVTVTSTFLNTVSRLNLFLMVRRNNHQSFEHRDRQRGRLEANLPWCELLVGLVL